MYTKDKFDMRTSDLVSENIEKLAVLSPHCVAEKNLNRIEI